VQRDEFVLNCPAPVDARSTVQMAHGGGGSRMRELVERLFRRTFTPDAATAAHDSAVLALDGMQVAFTTDSYVVRPLFFPGGDIGKLAVCGTINDLAMAGARPLFLSAGFILEEGLPMATLERVVTSMQAAARDAGVSIVTGDTKVVDRGHGDGIYVNTAGIGLVPEGIDVRPERVRAGDAVLLSGDIGRHGVAILSVREGLEFEAAIESDCAEVASMVAALVDAGIDLHCLRDPTRGGLASALAEIAQDAAVTIEIRETSVPVEEPVRAACEILGLDPFYVANEGCFVAFVPEADAARALGCLRTLPAGRKACRIGSVTTQQSPCVVLDTVLGTRRVLDLLSGEQLPRIC
jgi:hydrogenase expression/formation protein HypE